MSNNIFPAIVQGQWDYTYPIKRSPLFSTILQTPANRIGCVHISLTPFNTWVYDLNLEILKGYANAAGQNSAYHTVIGFYGGMKASFDTFLYNDPQDNGVDSNGAAITYNSGTGDGSTAIFQTIRTLGPAGSPQLVDLIQNWPSAPNVFVVGVLQTPVTAYVLDEYGTITFQAGHIPVNNAAVTWSGKFYFRAHFEEDTLGNLQEEFFDIWSLSSLKFTTELV